MVLGHWIFLENIVARWPLCFTTVFFYINQYLQIFNSVLLYKNRYKKHFVKNGSQFFILPFGYRESTFWSLFCWGHRLAFTTPFYLHIKSGRERRSHLQTMNLFLQAIKSKPNMLHQVKGDQVMKMDGECTLAGKRFVHSIGAKNTVT